MKLYRVNIFHGDGQPYGYRLWEKYSSAISCKGAWARRGFTTTVDEAHIPDGLWKPVQRIDERLLSQLTTVVWRLVDRDKFAEVEDRVAEVRRLQSAWPATAEGVDAGGLAELTRLVDAG